MALLVAAPAAAQPASAAGSRLLTDEALLLLPGEQVTAKLDEKGRLSAFVASSTTTGEAQAEDGGVSLKLEYRATGNMLTVRNRTAKAFDYEVAILERPEFPSRGQATTVCTIAPGLFAFESWPGERIPALLVGAFRPKDTPDMGCPQTTNALRDAAAKK